MILNDTQWPMFQAIADQAGLTVLAKTAARIGQLYFGMPLANCTWCTDADEQLCYDLLIRLLDSGNFGSKHQKDTITVHALYRMQHGLFHTLQTSGERNWSILEKNRGLRPFAWMYQAFRYLHLGMQGSQTLSKIVTNFHASRRLKQLMRQLGCD